MTLYKVYCHVTLLSQYVAFEGPFGACNVDTSFLTLKGMIYHGICDLIKGYKISAGVMVWQWGRGRCYVDIILVMY